jgi:quinol monooxygenase YgiN
MGSSTNGPVTLINVFTVKPANQQRLIDLLSAVTERSVRYAPGFISARLHRSLDGTKVTMYALWRSVADYESDAHRSRPITLPEASTRDRYTRARDVRSRQHFFASYKIHLIDSTTINQSTDHFSSETRKSRADRSFLSDVPCRQPRTLRRHFGHCAAMSSSRSASVTVPALLAAVASRVPRGDSDESESAC